MLIRDLGLVPYLETQAAMQEFVAVATSETEDEMWLLEHPPVYTQGTGCNLNTFVPSAIPMVKSDRGGQITYHGPGQLVLYTLMNLKRNNLGIKTLVKLLEQSVIDLLKGYQINAVRKEGAPGVYVDGAKIAALGLRVKKGFSYHGLSFNVDMDLSPFNNIDPCGYQGLKVTQLSDFQFAHWQESFSIESVQQKLVGHFQRLLK